MKKNKKSKKNKMMALIPLILIPVVVVGGCFFFFKSPNSKEEKKSLKVLYVSASHKEIEAQDEEGKLAIIPRGSKVELLEENVLVGDKQFDKVVYHDNNYYISHENLTEDEKDIVTEKERFVRTSCTVYSSEEGAEIKGFLKKGEKVEILGYTKVDENGEVKKYKIRYQDGEGYIRSKYLVETEKLALAIYDEEGTYQEHLKMGTSKGEDASTLDYYPVEKPKFADNVMPDEVRAFYLNSSVLVNLDSYIELAKDSNINAFVVDIKEDTAPAYKADAMKKYSPTNYERGLYSKEQYKEYIQKLKDNGFYVIGRIVTFKDGFYAKDHPEDTIHNKKTNQPLEHNNSYWPSAYQRSVWEFNVELAIESIRDIGFHEIQFDYVRFPDQTTSLENAGVIDFKNEYQESKAEAIQAFAMYASDEIHEYGAYISIDVFGECAHDYVTAYGQYWPAISNVVDVISGMPYPDHFNAHEYNISSYVWQVPYEVLKAWGEYAKRKQDMIPTPAIARTWIQAYDTGRSPKVVYDSTKVADQIRGLYANQLNGGYMTWNSGSNIQKYREIQLAFKREYVR